MTELLLNAPLWLIVLLAVMGLGLLVSSLRSGRGQLRTAAIACFAVALLLLGLKYVAPTDQKKVERETRRLAEAVVAKDWPTVTEMLKYASLYDLSGQPLTARVRQQVEAHGIKQLDIRSTESARIDPFITVTLSVTTHHDNAYIEAVPSTWSMDWQKRGGSWILTDIRVIRIGTWTGAEAEALVK